MKAQETFYYCGGCPVKLQKSEHKISIRASSSEQIVLPAVYIPADTIADGNVCIRTYKCPTNAVTPKTLSGSDAITRRITPCYTNSTGLELTPTGYISVKLKTTADIQLLEEDAKRYGLDIVYRYEHLPLWYLLVQQPDAEDSPIDIANALYESNRYASASPDFAYNGFEISYDPEVRQQWGLYNSEYKGFDISVSNAWNYATGKGVNVAVVDRGIDHKHVDISTNMGNCYYTMGVDDEKDWFDDIFSHGTQCAGIIAAIRNNGIGTVGVSPDSKIIEIRAHIKYACAQNAEVSDGISWAAENGADIISCSWQCAEGKDIDEAIEKALKQGRNGKGCIIVKSAGNTGNEITCPGNITGVIAVANMQQDGTLHKESAHGENLFITAPGTNIRTINSNDRVCSVTGTSFAAPHVAGVAALILETDPSLTYNEVREILAKTAKKIGPYKYDTEKEYGSWNEYYGYGLVDADSAVQMTLQQKEEKSNK